VTTILVSGAKASSAAMPPGFNGKVRAGDDLRDVDGASFLKPAGQQAYALADGRLHVQTVMLAST
jgi:hypothetical protein